MRLYHGSNMRVTDIDLLKSRPAKDFGRAFYLSADREQAVDMGRFKVDTLVEKLWSTSLNLTKTHWQN